VTRKQERMRRMLQWLGILSAGAVGGIGLGGWIGAGFFAAALALGHRRMIAPPGVAILTYHSVAEDPRWLPWAYEIAVSPRTFARHADVLRKMNCTVMGTRDYLAFRAAGEVLPYRPVILHFDDGYLDNWLFAVPILRSRRLPATFFPSLDFIEPGETIRPVTAETSGYMNWAELQALEAYAGFEVEPHGIDHGRVPISERGVGVLTERNWRRHAWMQWAATQGPKHDWYRSDRPAAVPLGSAVPESGLALATRGWVNGERESEAAFEARVTEHLLTCRDTFLRRLGRAPQVFCWPENKTAPESRAIAAALGYRATTGGRRRNTAGEPASVLSRIHMGDRALGFRWLFAEGLHLRAAVRLAQGNLYWYLAVGPMNWTRAIVTRLRLRGRA
jgi:peptidoglycan/xylan/chitin deacetylase (PgdA/CDA1 family)